jgi:hypothetical protein
MIMREPQSYFFQLCFKFNYLFCLSITQTIKNHEFQYNLTLNCKFIKIDKKPKIRLFLAI